MTEEKENPKKRRTKKSDKEDFHQRLKGKQERDRKDLAEEEEFLQDPAQIEKDFKEVANDPRVYEDRSDDGFSDSEDEEEEEFFYAEEADSAGEDDNKI